MSRAAEDGIHDFEEECTMHACNFADGTDDQLVCDAGGSSGAAGYSKTLPSAAAVLGGAAAVMTMMV